ncbi:winged helix-turn-helix domain-containing protein [Vibrio sp. SA48]
MRTRLLAISHFVDVKSRTQIAKYLKISRTSVNNWVATSLKNGVKGLVEKQHTGRPPQLTEDQLFQLKLYITSNAIKPEGGRLQETDIIEFIHKEFGLSYSLSGIYKILRKLDLVWITTRSKQSVEAQEAFPNRNDP